MVLAIVGRVTFPPENSGNGDIGVDGDDCVVVDDDDVGNLTTILRANDTMGMIMVMAMMTMIAFVLMVAMMMTMMEVMVAIMVLRLMMMMILRASVILARAFLSFALLHSRALR